MTKLEKAELKSRILKLSRLKATGRPADLARRFETSERTIKRRIRELRAEGYNIVFNYYNGSYVLKKDAKNEKKFEYCEIFVPGAF